MRLFLVPVPILRNTRLVLNKSTRKKHTTAYAYIISISEVPKTPYLNAFTMYKIGLNKLTFCQNSGSKFIE
tara:strand:- start:3 stop:215 length:213 start_codon:yes stop_codon:yes gene_type:complete